MYSSNKTGPFIIHALCREIKRIQAYLWWLPTRKLLTNQKAVYDLLCKACYSALCGRFNPYFCRGIPTDGYDTMKSHGMLRGLLSFSSVTMVSRVLGLVRDMAMSHVFGASVATDAFVIAFRIPNFMRRLFAEGSFSTAFVPVLTEAK